MRRREFITLLGGAAAAWPLAAQAQQQPGKRPTIGLLTAGAPATHGQWVDAFVQRLHELGWVEGRTIAIEYRWAEGHSDRYAKIAAEFVRLNVNVIVTQGGAAAAAKKATSVIPIVFTVAADPLVVGLVASLAQPSALARATMSTPRQALCCERSTVNGESYCKSLLRRVLGQDALHRTAMHV